MPSNTSVRLWYQEPGAVETWFHGVFEGGGAKGVAYSGALIAMRQRRCWFKAVAGASAGAITASLIAAGLSPQEMEQATLAALASVRTSVWNGIWRLRDEGGYFASAGLRNWLDERLKEAVMRCTGESRRAVTFAQLYAATGIELNVIAADLSTNRQIVFSHLDTPDCVVADAVVASSAIPFAFPNGLLAVPSASSGHEVVHHTIVDGGVWSNFPMFVFEDPAFRAHYGRAQAIAGDEILGFVLKEERISPPVRGQGVGFVPEGSTRPLHASEWRADAARLRQPSGVVEQSAVGLLRPLRWLGRLLKFNSGVERGRWPLPQSPLRRSVVGIVDRLLDGIHPPLFGLIAWLIVAVGGWVVGAKIVEGEIGALMATDWSHPMAYVIRPVTVGLTLLIVAVCILLPFASVLAIAANLFLLRAARRILYGLVTTYVAGPGTPEWITRRSNVIALPIPPTMTALDFDITDAERKSLIEAARSTTLEQLAHRLRRGQESLAA